MTHRKYIIIAVSVLVVTGLSLAYMRSTGGLRECQNLEAGDKQDQCFINYAKENTDIEICSNVSEKSQTACQREIYIATEDMNQCLALKNGNPLDSDICISGIAKIKSDLSLCGKIELSAAQDSCIKQVVVQSNDPAKCELIENQTQKEFCYIKIAQNAKDIKVCENISNETQLKLCLSEYKLVTGEAPNCSDLIKENSRQICSGL